MKRILAAVDGSPDSFAAAELAATLARATSAQLELVFIIEPAMPRLPVEHAGAPEFEQQQRRRAEQAFEQIAARLETKVATRIERGGPAERLCELAGDPEVTMVVAGSRGHHSLLRGLVGSAAQRLTRSCPKPLVIVHAPSGGTAP